MFSSPCSASPRSQACLEACGTAIFLMLFGVAGRASGAVINVTTLEDKISGTGGCSLKEAIYAANFDASTAIAGLNPDGTDNIIATSCNAGSGDDTIILPGGAIFLMSSIVDDAHNPFGPTATPIITSNITIDANGSRLQWVGTQDARAFAVTGANLTIVNAYITGFVARGGDGAVGGGGGLGAGGAIFFPGIGSLAVENSTFQGNGAIGGSGSTKTGTGGGGGGLGGNGGQYNPKFGGPILGGGTGGGGSRGNGGSELEGGGGGGGTVTNGAEIAGGLRCGGNGGSGSTSLNASAGSCTGGGGGGGGGNFCLPLTFDAPGNGGNGNFGGGGGGGGTCGDRVGSNGGNGGFGGGGGSAGGTGSITSTEGGNGGYGGGGGTSPDNPGRGGVFGGNADTSFGGGGGALGGAIFNIGGTVRVSNSTFNGNFVRRGTSGGGTADNGADEGGAIFSLTGSLTVLNATISGNQSTGEGAGVVIDNRGNLAPISFNLHNTILSNLSARECFFFENLASVDAIGSGNLIANNFGCPGAIASVSDPGLGPLQRNAPGNTPTMAIATSSPAFNAADRVTSLPTDQRGVLRPALGGFDIGAYELCTFRPEFDPCTSVAAPPPNTELLTVLVSRPADGSTSPASGSFAQGAVVALAATPNPGFAFKSWTGNVTVPTSASTTIVMDQPQTVTANFVPCGCAADVSSSVTVTRAGFVLNPATGRYAQSVTVTNISANTITGPISLVLDSLSSNATLFTVTGTTDSLELPAGSPYLNANVNLAAGKNTVFMLQFTDPSHAAISYNTRVLAGSGAR
jgi:hypothetical protein